MLFVLIVLLLVASVFVLLMKKNRESLCLLGMCCSLMVHCQKGRIFQKHHQFSLFLAGAEK